MAKPTNKTKTRYALLGILSTGAASGYDIKKMMEQSTDHFWREGDGSIYPILKLLLEEGMVTCEIGNKNSDKPKKIYTITSDGEQELQDWLKDEPVVYQHRLELLLKIFFGWNVDTSITIQHIEKFRQKIISEQAKYKNYDPTLCNPDAKVPYTGAKLYQFITQRAGIMHSETSLKWCDEALRLLRNV